MATGTLTATVSQVDTTQKLHRLYGTLAISAGGTYATGGLALSAVLMALSSYDSDQPPLWIDIVGIGGYIYQYNPATGKMMILVGAGGTPSGTIVSTATAPTITTATGDPTVAPIGVVTGALAQTAGAAGITGVQAPIVTSTFTGAPGAGGAAGQIANSGSLAGPIADTIQFRCEFMRGI